jgi:hypothetical protein
MTAAGAMGMISLTTDAFCQGQYQYRVYYTQTPDPILDLLFIAVLCLAALLLAAWLAGCLSSGSSDSPCDCAESVAEREASLMREITKQQDAHTALMRSEIDHARTSGEYRELPEIAEHEQRLRELRSKLR